MDDSTVPGVLAIVGAELAAMATRLHEQLTAGADLARVEGPLRRDLLALGGRLLEAGIAASGTGKDGPRQPCGCGAAAGFTRYRTKQVQTLLGWITVRRASYGCAACGSAWCPLDRTLGLERDSPSPAVRQLSVEFGARLPFATAAGLLATAAEVHVSASSVRGWTERFGARREAALASEIARAWAEGLPPSPDPAPERLYVAMDGVRILGADGAGREIKVGVVQPEHADARRPATFVAGLEPAAAFGQRLALEAHRRGVEHAGAVAVLGDGAAWIWNLVAEHFPAAVQIVDWFHANERVWDLGRALWGEQTPATERWVGQQLGRLAAGQAARLAHEWDRLECSGPVAAVRDEQVTYFTNQAPRMADDRYRADGWDIGSGMVEGACKHLIGAREKGPGMRWSDAGAQTVAAVRVALFNGDFRRAA